MEGRLSKFQGGHYCSPLVLYNRDLGDGEVYRITSALLGFTPLIELSQCIYNIHVISLVSFLNQENVWLRTSRCKGGQRDTYELGYRIIYDVIFDKLKSSTFFSEKTALSYFFSQLQWLSLSRVWWRLIQDCSIWMVFRRSLFNLLDLVVSFFVYFGFLSWFLFFSYSYRLRLFCALMYQAQLMIKYLLYQVWFMFHC